MFSNLTLYYLNQLGIAPWINKESSLKLLDKLENTPLKLVVLVSSDLSNKAQVLFNRMMDYINVENDELLIIKMTPDLADYKNRPWLTQIEKNTPHAILALGLNTNDLLVDLNSTYPIVQSFTPEYLLDNPSDKKRVFHDLSALQGLLS